MAVEGYGWNYYSESCYLMNYNQFKPKKPVQLYTGHLNPKTAAMP